MSEKLIARLTPNLIVLGALVAVFAAGKLLDIPAIQDIFVRIDDLTGNLVLVLIAITMGILVDRYIYVAASIIGILGTMIVMPGLFPFGNILPAQVAAVAFMLLGFSAIANIFRHTRRATE